MSLKSWIKEFYPIPAHKVTKKNAIDACILKWRGLSKANLERHRMHQEHHIIREMNGTSKLFINEESCALCKFYVKYHCNPCPLAIVRDGISCDVSMESEDLNPWEEYRAYGDTKPMLLWLRKAKKWGR